MLSSLKEDFFWPNLISTWTASTRSAVISKTHWFLYSWFTLTPLLEPFHVPNEEWHFYQPSAPRQALRAVYSKAMFTLRLQGKCQHPRPCPQTPRQNLFWLRLANRPLEFLWVEFVSDDEVTSTGPSKPCYLSDTFQQESFKYSPCFYGWSVEKHLRIQGLLPNNNKNSNESSSSSSLSSLMLMGHVAWTTLLCSGTVSACTR